jgi:NTP pyrophosphatase (non-canonical NTP hydrolase)
VTPSEFRIASVSRARQDTPLLDNKQVLLALCGLGLAGECAEVVEAFMSPRSVDIDVIKEVGDVLWYIDRLLMTIDNDFVRVYAGDFHESDERTCWSLILHAGSIADLVKKHLFHGIPLKVPELVDFSTRIVSCLHHILRAVESSVPQAMQMNVEKLAKRWPNGFEVGAIAA